MITLFGKTGAQNIKFSSPEKGTSIKYLKRKITKDTHINLTMPDMTIGGPAMTSGFISGMTGIGQRWIWFPSTSFGGVGTWLQLESFGEHSINIIRNAPVDTVPIGIDSGYYKCNFTENLILVERPGFKTTTLLIHENEFKPNKNHIKLPPLEELPRKQKLGFDLYIKTVYAITTESNHVVKEYDTYNDYKNGTFASGVAQHSVNLFGLDLYDYLNHICSEYGLQDTLIPNNDSLIYLDISVNKLTEHKFIRFAQLDLSTELTFYRKKFINDDYSEDILRITKYNCKSYIGYDMSKNLKMNNISLYINALENLMITVIKDIQNKKLLIPRQSIH